MSEDHHAAMQAYQEYMLSGKLPTTPIKSLPAEGSSPLARKDLFFSPQESPDSKGLKRVDKRMNQLIKIYATILQNEWLHTDEQLQAVISAILNIRQRLPIEHKMVLDHETNVKSDLDKNYKPPYIRQNESTKDLVWHPSTGFLTLDDVELALEHDLAQHEKMMGHVRKLLKQLYAANEALGRHFENIMQHQNDNWETIQKALQEQPLEGPMERMVNNVDRASRILLMLSNELYRKQVMAQSVLDTLDGLICAGQDYNNETKGTSKGIKVAKNAASNWSMGSKQTCVNLEFLQAFLKEFGTW